MTLPQQYAKALERALQEHPRSSTKLFAGLKAALKRRGHVSLLPSILAEYKKLELRKSRAPQQSAKKDRTRVLLQLYRHLTRHSSTTSL